CIVIFPFAFLLAFIGAHSAWSADRLTILRKFDRGDFANGYMPPQGVYYDAASNALFGTTEYGGNKTCHEGDGCGVVFALTADSNRKLTTFTRLHIFEFNMKGGEDGDGGGNVVLDGAGSLYGTAQMGGDPNCAGTLGCGIVYMLEAPLLGKAKPKEQILHVFENSDGLGPYGRLLIDGSSGALYGATYGGGTNGLGTVFKLAPNANKTKWEFSVLYNFQQSPDGYSPTASLIMDSQNRLYGTTRYGGKGENPGFGTVFSLRPVNGGWKEHTLFDFHPHA